MDKPNRGEAGEHKTTSFSATLGSIHPRAHAQQRSAEPRRRTVPSEPPLHGPCNPASLHPLRRLRQYLQNVPG